MNKIIQDNDAKWNAGQSNPSTANNENDDNAWTNLQSTTINGLKVVAEGTVRSKESFGNGNYQIFITGDGIPSDKIISQINWGNVELITDTPENLRKVENLWDENYGVNIYNVNNSTQVYHIKAGTWVRIPNAIILQNGQRKDLEVMFTKPENSSETEWLSMWNDNGAINYLNSNEAQGGRGKPNSIRSHYRVAGDHNSNYLWTNIISDTDVGQYITKGENTEIISVGGGLRYTDGRIVYSRSDLGGGSNQALDGLNSSPAGTMVHMGYTNLYVRQINNLVGGQALGIADLDFGGAPLRFSVPIKLEPRTPDPIPELPVEPVAPTPPTNEAVPPGERPVAPEKPKAIYNNYILKYIPNPIKNVTNGDGVDINGNLVAKDSQVKWVLNNEVLKPNRDLITSFVIEDALPTGFEIDTVATALATPAYTVEYSLNTHTVKFTATKATLEAFNSDLSANMYVPIAQIVGRVKNDGAEYLNTFKTTIVSQDVEFVNGIPTVKNGTPPKTTKLTSNIVVVRTPGNDPKIPRVGIPNIPGETPGEDPTPNDNLIKPEKDNLNKDGVSINGKAVAAGSENLYTLKWDLDQYKGMISTKESIARGFYHIDDYPEEAVNLVPNKISIVDSFGKPVTGISVASYESLSTAPKEVKDMIKHAGLESRLKGSFQLFTADNPEDFFKKYVVEGNSLYITTPMTVKDELGKTGVEYRNMSYQVDFGNGYYANEVINNVPTPKPQKENLNKDGVNINGKNVLPGSVNMYRLTWDLGQYKDIHADKEIIEKGFYFFDDFPEEALTPLTEAIKLVDSKGESVVGVSLKVYNSLSEAPENIQKLLKNSGINGAFQVFSADNPHEFFEKYVKTGMNIYITNPMQVKPEMAKTGGKYENKAIQSDFGNVHETEIVENNVPKLDPMKDVTIKIDGESVDGGVITLGQTFNYHLIGAKLPGNRSETLWQYSFKDDYQETHDEYTGQYKVTALVDITLSDGTVIKAGTDLTEFTKQTVDSDKGVITVDFTYEFLSKVSNESEFQSGVYLQMTRIAPGEVENKYTNIVNGVELVSNTVKTTTPVPPKNTPMLPNTGEDGTLLSGLIGIMSLGFGALAIKKRKES